MGNVVERSRSPTRVTQVEPATSQHIHSPHQAAGSRPGISLLSRHCHFDGIPGTESVVQACVRDPNSRLKAKGGVMRGMEGHSPHGHKRRAEDELANDQRLIKRFNLLNLGWLSFEHLNTGRLLG